jgi:excisionase family DNA binding protein
MESAPTDWLSIREASRFLGVHIGTIREWADAGILSSYRTAGGHRRFSVTDLQRFLDQQRKSPNGDSPTDRALQRVRNELFAHPHPQWLQHLSAQLTEAQRAQQRECGRQLLACVIAFAEEPLQRERLLDEGRRVARKYGRALVASGLSAGNAARATIHFRQLILKTVLDTQLGSRTGDEEDAKLFQRVSAFLDEILLAIIDAYP